MTQVNKERMLAEFKEIVALPCHSLQERPVFELLKGKLEALGFTVEEDDAGEKLGGNCGNMWAFLPASAGVEGAVRVLLSAHMDGVEPCGGSDANFLNAYGLPSVILGTGMANVHTVDEYIKEEDLYNSALMVHGILKAAVK